MKINYWDCKYSDYQEYWDGIEETRAYGCTNPENEDCSCEIDNKWGGEKYECDIAEIEANEDKD